MTTNDQNSGPFSNAQRRARRFRMTGIIFLLLGVAGAGVVYWLGSRAPDFSDDPAMAGFNRAEERQMGMLYGKQGQFIEDLTQALKQPGTQAGLIAAASAVIAAGCLYFARVLEEEAKPVDVARTPPV